MNSLNNSKPGFGIFKTILFAWLLAGTLDLLAAIAWFLMAGGKEPSRVFMFIASGYFGKAAFAQAITGGDQMTAMGILFHYLIAFCFTVLFFLVYPKIQLLQKSVFLSAVLFGVFTWLVMNIVVVPLSKINTATFHPLNVCIGIFILILLFSLPIAVIIKQFYKNQLSRQ